MISPSDDIIDLSISLPRKITDGHRNIHKGVHCILQGPQIQCRYEGSPQFVVYQTNRYGIAWSNHDQLFPDCVR
ncbi:Os01g0810700 [Oryza sativa Japonica Group]|uniref:Os01g0810700 protein n=1 Tax=Oryza sativa subsp. japonica TaxID=39947 RepID=A0A0P0V9H0_ORYSJ|nr:hypothetical protein EE612_006403 [Oryza sativa]BAS74870.1 Os01g0810700 [Oryza sativa Japonica Group]